MSWILLEPLHDHPQLELGKQLWFIPSASLTNKAMNVGVNSDYGCRDAAIAKPQMDRAAFLAPAY